MLLRRNLLRGPGMAQPFSGSPMPGPGNSNHMLLGTSMGVSWAAFLGMDLSIAIVSREAMAVKDCTAHIAMRMETAARKVTCSVSRRHTHSVVVLPLD